MSNTDAGALHTRLVPGFVTDTELVPGARIVTFFDGSTARELLVASDDEDRRLVWSIVDSPLGITHHNGAARVFAAGPVARGVVAVKRDVFRDLVHCNKMYDLIAMRRPVITSRTRSVEAYFSDDAFLWFTAEDPEDLARAIRELYAEPELGDRLVEQAGEEVEPYRWPRQREQYKRYVLSAPSGSRPAVGDV